MEGLWSPCFPLSPSPHHCQCMNHPSAPLLSKLPFSFSLGFLMQSPLLRNREKWHFLPPPLTVADNEHEGVFRRVLSAFLQRIPRAAFNTLQTWEHVHSCHFGCIRLQNTCSFVTDPGMRPPGKGQGKVGQFVRRYWCNEMTTYRSRVLGEHNKDH